MKQRPQCGGLATQDVCGLNQAFNGFARDAQVGDRVSPLWARHSAKGERQDARVFHYDSDLRAETDDELVGILHVDTTASTSPQVHIQLLRQTSIRLHVPMSSCRRSSAQVTDQPSTSVISTRDLSQSPAP